ncbi:MAG: hypothetical protein RLY35_839 [Bacteroidota bacterium]|jgi:hypothetical protein
MSPLQKTYAWVIILIVMVYAGLCLIGPEKYESSQTIKIRCSNQKLAWALSDFNEWKKWFKDWDLEDSTHLKIVGEPMMAKHGVVFNHNGMSQTMEVKAIYASLDSVDLIQIQRSVSEIEEPDAEIEFHLSEDNKGLAVLTCSLKQGEIPWLFRGAIWATGNAHHWDEWNQENLENLKNYLEAMPSNNH